MQPSLVINRVMDKLFSFPTLILVISLMLATVSGVFSVLGMMAIFTGLPWVGMIVGGAIEMGKLAGVSWLYRFWNDRVWFRHIFAAGTLIAMLVTSVGVFGMLTKAHSTNATPTSNSIAQIEVIDQKISREQTKISAANEALAQLDSQINVLVQHSKISMKGGAIEVRKQQQSEREHLETIIDKSQDKIDELQTKKFDASQVIRNFEADVGPITQLSEFIPESMLGDSTDKIGRSVSILILLIMLSLDPMAIMLLMGYNHVITRTPVIPPTEEPPKLESVVAPVVDSTPTQPDATTYGSQMNDPISSIDEPDMVQTQYETTTYDLPMNEPILSFDEPDIATPAPEKKPTTKTKLTQAGWCYVPRNG